MDHTRTSWYCSWYKLPSSLSFALAALLIVVDIVIYYPFLKVYDEQILEEERSGKTNDGLKEKGCCKL